MEYNLLQQKMYAAFHKEFKETYLLHTRENWTKFIKHKNIGIEFICYTCSVEYKIVNEKKWLMTRLKYGI